MSIEAPYGVTFASDVLQTLKTIPVIFHPDRDLCIVALADMRVASPADVPSECVDLIGQFAHAIDDYRPSLVENCVAITKRQSAIAAFERRLHSAVRSGSLRRELLVSSVLLEPGSELAYIASIAYSERDWLFWRAGLETTISPDSNVAHLLQVEALRPVLPLISAECDRVRPQFELPAPSQVLASHVRRVQSLCARPELTVDRVWDVLRFSVLSLLPGGGLRKVVDKVFTGFLSEADYRSLQSCWEKVKRIPDMIFRSKKVSVLANPNAGACNEFLTEFQYTMSAESPTSLTFEAAVDLARTLEVKVTGLFEHPTTSREIAERLTGVEGVMEAALSSRMEALMQSGSGVHREMEAVLTYLADSKYAFWEDVIPTVWLEPVKFKRRFLRSVQLAIIGKRFQMITDAIAKVIPMYSVEDRSHSDDSTDTEDEDDVLAAIRDQDFDGLVFYLTGGNGHALDTLFLAVKQRQQEPVERLVAFMVDRYFSQETTGPFQQHPGWKRPGFLAPDYTGPFKKLKS